MMSKKEFIEKGRELEDQIKNYLDDLNEAVKVEMDRKYGRILECGMTDARTELKGLMDSIDCCIDELND